MGMILIPAYFVLALIFIIVCVMMAKSSKPGGGIYILTSICLIGVGGMIFWYFVYPFFTGH
jgi:hypothetical protein